MLQPSYSAKSTSWAGAKTKVQQMVARAGEAAKQTVKSRRAVGA